VKAFSSKLSSVTKGELYSMCRQIPPSHEPRKGVVDVKILQDEEGVLTLFEKGTWVGTNSRQEISFTNTLRFRFAENKIILEHLRFGKNHPELLFELEQIEPHLFRSLKPYLCKEDTYTGSVLFDEHYIHLDWQVKGPRKSASYRVVYTS